MNKRILSLVMTVLLIIMTAAFAGCGVDTSKLAGSASQLAGEAADISDDAADDQASPADGEETAQYNNSSDAAGGLKYDASDFLSTIEPWSGQPYCEINGNVPDIEEIWATTQESLDPLDSLGRCGTANSCIGTEGMPTEPRGNISEIHPTGWHSDKYDGVEGGNLFNRCHLIAHKLSGDDAVARNLITGTSYRNRQGMLPFEDQIYEYVTSTGNHVMYRVAPCFAGDELVARGVHMQAISVEDQGKGLAFNVFCYNVQPGIEIDYATGDNRLAGDTSKVPEAQEDNKVSAEDTNSNEEAQKNTYVLNTNTKKFHVKSCNSVNQMKDKNKQEIEATRDEVIAKGYEPCGNCHP